ncbi:hypothetical protein CEP54_000533 [Fusarium duplospermum]|uniref:Calcineurin-like phosphoesterase domain-containing protein n=1 Tax=Fusarium duplospermum TaxID=1325734 RepID=A0A428R6G1_9HYPO|nr:hypothetical protein CEP54_000533 [Fusarium duplospermum]
MAIMITARQRRLLVLLSTAFFVFSVFYCCSRLASLTMPQSDQTKYDQPKVEISRADNPMSYGMYNRPAYDSIDLVRNLPSEYIPTKANGRRLVVIGDIHGMLDPFEKLLKKITFDPKRDHIVAVGDMVNKGPKTPELINRLMELKASAVRGNHEDRVILAWAALNAQQGVQAYLDSESEAKRRGEDEDLKTARSLNEAQMNWLRNLPVILSAESMSLFIVHAGLVPGVPVHQQDPWAVMNMRTLRFPRAEFRIKEIERKRKQEEKKKKQELEKQQEEEKKQKELEKQWAQEMKKPEGKPSKRDESSSEEEAAVLVPRAQPDPAASARDPALQLLSTDRDVWIPVNDRGGEQWSDLWNAEQRKLPAIERRSIIYGHDAKMGYKEDTFTFGLDSGCVKGNALTALVIQGTEDGGWKPLTFQVSCKKGWF